MLTQALVGSIVFVAVAACLHPLYRAWLRRKERRESDVAAWRAAENAEFNARRERG